MSQQNFGATGVPRDFRGVDYGMTEAGESRENEAAGVQQEIANVAKNIQNKLSTLMEERPYVLPIAAGGAGLLAGMILSSKLTRVMILVGAGYALSELAKSGGIEKIGSIAERLATK